jgi:glycosyltransferase involved in cell wall biosynthesis
MQSPSAGSTQKNPNLHIRLNMIVRDEAHTIEAALDSVRPIIDSFCIVDTGSQDDTISLITRWGDINGISGQVHQSTWVNFGYNRTEALSFANVDNSASHILFLDADDRIVVEPSFEKSSVKLSTSYYLDYLSGGIHYTLPGLISVGENRGWRWQGALHEFLERVQHQPTFESLGKVRVLKNVVKGGRSIGLSQRDKYLRDAAILENELSLDPENSRNAFYLAQSYRDAGDSENAHRWYLRRASMPGWDQETYQAMLEAGKCLERLERVDEALSQYFNAWEFRRPRCCALYHCIRIFRTRRSFGLGLHFSELAYSCINYTNDSLFIDQSIYDWKLADETSICAYWEGKYDYSVELCERILARSDIPQIARDRIVKNLDFAVHRLSDKNSAL